MYWAVQSPIPGNPGVRRQRLPDRGQAEGRARSGRRPAQAPDGHGACRTDAQSDQFRLLGIGQTIGTGAEPVRPENGTSTGSPNRAASRPRASAAPDRDPLAQDGAPRPSRSRRSAPARAGPGSGRPGREPWIACELVRDDIRPRAMSKRFFNRASTSGNAGVSDMASSTASVFRPVSGSTFNHPQCDPTAAVRKYAPPRPARRPSWPPERNAEGIPGQGRPVRQGEPD